MENHNIRQIIIYNFFLSNFMNGIPLSTVFLFLVFTTFRFTTSQNTNNNQSLNNQTIKCQRTQYTSIFTRCEINFDYCNSTSFSFIECHKNQCERYVRASQCRLWTKIQLTESQCYKQCCGTTNFTEQACNQFNQQKQQSQSQISAIIIAVIVISSVVLVSVAAFLLIKVQKCCKKTEFKKISKYNIFWRNQKVPDSVCQICKNYGAVIQTPCSHYFHASCFEQNTREKDLPMCPTCQIPIKQRLKIACHGCKEKVFKIKLWRIAHFQQILKQARALHDEICPQSSKSDQHLLSPINM